MKRTLTIFALMWGVSSQAQLKKLYDREFSYGHFSGVVQVVSAEDTLLRECYGRQSFSEAMTIETRFDIGSISKQFTAAAVLKLVQQNMLKLQDPINLLLGKYASDRWKKVTVHQLLTHTSGIPSVYQTEQGLDIFFPEKDATTLTDLIAKFSDGKLLFSPGEEFSYSNSGYILLAAIIEQVSNQSFESYLNEMFQEYGLENTSFERDEDSATPMYGYRHDLLQEAPVNHKSWYVGAGGIYSNLSDLSRWIHVIQSEEFLNWNLRDKYLRSHTRAGYGYGWQFQDNRIQHDGGNDGFISFLSFDPDTETSIIVLTNRSFQDIKMFGKSAEYVRGLVDRSWDAIAGKEIEVLPEIKQSELSAGSFHLDETEFTLTKNDTSLVIHSSGMSPSRVICSTSLSGQDSSEQKMIDIANYLERGKYWSLAKLCDGEMKFVMYSGMMSIGMRMMKKQVGEMDRIIPYYVDDSKGYLRMIGDEGILDLVVYFDNEGLIQGVFENGNYSTEEVSELIAYPIGKGLYYLDGLPFGEKSATLRVAGTELTFYQLNRSVNAYRK